MPGEWNATSPRLTRQRLLAAERLGVEQLARTLERLLVQLGAGRQRGVIAVQRNGCAPAQRAGQRSGRGLQDKALSRRFMARSLGGFFEGRLAKPDLGSGDLEKRHELLAVGTKLRRRGS